MPHGCWIDLYEAPDCSGERRRVFGPGELDAVVWQRFAASDQISLVVGPRATARVRCRGRPDLTLEAEAREPRLTPGEIESIRIDPATAAPDEDAAGVVRRDVDDAPPPPPSRPKRRRVGRAAEEQSPSGAGT